MYLREKPVFIPLDGVGVYAARGYLKAHRYLFLLAKQPHYYFDHRAIQEPLLTYPQGKNKRRNDFARAEGKRAQVVLPGRGVVPQHRADRRQAGAQQT